VDENGKEVYQLSYIGQDKIGEGFEYTFDETGWVTECVRYFTTGTIQTTTYTYEDTDTGYLQRSCTVESRRNDDGSMTVPEFEEGVDYEYDANGNRIKEVDYRGSDAEYVREYTYASDGTLLKEIKKGGENAGTILYHYEVDEAGNMQKDLNYNEDGSISYGTEWLYDAEGLLQERIGYDQGKKVSHEQYFYESGLLVKCERSNSDGKVVYEATYKYDNQIEKVVNEYHDVIGGQTRTVYEYEKIKIK